MEEMCGFLWHSERTQIAVMTLSVSIIGVFRGGRGGGVS